jgi:thiamine biosynthesis lipoprotein
MIKVARNAMATRFEIATHGENPVSVRAAAEEALDEIQRVEQLLNLYNPGSEIAQLNAHAAHHPVRVSAELFRLLEQVRDLSMQTEGAFDVTVGPLIRCWGFMRGNGEMPSDSELAEARQKVGVSLVHLDPTHYEVRFETEGVMVDLGSVGKGYALDRAAGVLSEAGVSHALLHGGTSTVVALGENADSGKWRIAIDSGPLTSATETGPPLAFVDLQDESLSVSAVWGKYFEREGRKFGHVIDPRSGQPVESNLLAALILPSGLETDALSTALLVDGKAAMDRIISLRPEARLLLVQASKQGDYKTLAHGIRSA